MVIDWLDKLDAAGKMGIVDETGQLKKEKSKKKKKKKKIITKMAGAQKKKEGLSKILPPVSVLNSLDSLSSKSLESNLNL